MTNMRSLTDKFSAREPSNTPHEKENHRYPAASIYSWAQPPAYEPASIRRQLLVSYGLPTLLSVCSAPLRFAALPASPASSATAGSPRPPLPSTGLLTVHALGLIG